MYWPTSAAKVLDVPFPLDKGRIIRIRQSRKGNFFAALTKDALGVWDVRVRRLSTLTLDLVPTRATRDEQGGGARYRCARS
jgi:hypothetical protein